MTDFLLFYFLFLEFFFFIFFFYFSFRFCVVDLNLNMTLSTNIHKYEISNTLLFRIHLPPIYIKQIYIF